MISVGQTIGNYRITAKLGEGGMGIVYLAEHPVIGKKVAMKAIHPELSRNPEVVSRFMTEAKSVNQIGHDHIVDINDFGTTPDGEFYFVMEFLQGEAMSERLKRDGSFPLRQALAITAQVADALDASHKHGIVHRDLKPENIYLITRGSTKDFVKVLDFGLAKLTQGDDRVTHKTRTGSVMGTPYYMSPEQCEGKASIDNRADIYSLGVILFEMLTGKVPFGGEGYGEIIVKHITMAAPSARGFVPDLPRSVDLILFRALAKKREDRFQTMAELHAALLDPEAYAATAPAIGIPDDLTGVARAAGPMSRAELTRASQGRMGTIRGIGEDGSVPSTFRQGLGEVVEEPPRKSRAPKVLLAVAAVAAAAVGAVVFLKGQQNAASAQRAAAATPVAPAAPRQPASVRVNFNSDPIRATIVRADTGQELGQTPLSMELPYGDAAIEFVFKKDGFENKVVSIVPNLPAPLFATLQAIPPKVVEEKPAPVAVEPHPAAPPAHKPAKKKPHGPRLDDDAVLEPSFK